MDCDCYLQGVQVLLADVLDQTYFIIQFPPKTRTGFSNSAQKSSIGLLMGYALKRGELLDGETYSWQMRKN